MRKLKTIQKILWLVILLSVGMANEIVPLTQRYFHKQDRGVDYNRGTYLIVLADTSLKKILTEESTGDFIEFKKRQGFDVKVVDYNWWGGTFESLQYHLNDYFHNIDPMLEYVLLVGDIDGSYPIHSGTIGSYNEEENDVTDYPYTFFSNEDMLFPGFFIGRWSIRSQEDLRIIKFKTIQYSSMDYISDDTHLNRALIVAGNFDANSDTWPVTPVMTSKWLMDKTNYYGYDPIDTVFFTKENQEVSNAAIISSWNEGVGIVNYRGWGDSKGWKKPQFQIDDINQLNNGYYLPVVMSFVCNTGDFGSQIPQCFGEALITSGSINNPRGASAMIGPSDLDTDTRFNNVMCAVMWDELLEGRIPELAPALHAGKQALDKEFPSEQCGYYSCAEFYSHVYGVLGDPSLSVWMGKPNNMVADLESNPVLSSSFVSTVISDSVSDKVLMDVVGVLIYQGKLIAKGLSNSEGQLLIDFPSEYANSEMILYLNKSQYYQKKITLTIQTINDVEITPENNYTIPLQNSQYRYEVNETDYKWFEINEIGNNLALTDDSIMEIDIGFNFIYYGETYNKLTICSNGWASFLPCLKDEDQDAQCNSLAYFTNNSISNPLGPYGMIAPFFDDLDDDTQNPIMNVYYYLTNNADSLIVQWDNVANNKTNFNCPDSDCERETFQLILDGVNKSQAGNGEIIFQYKEIYDIDDHGSTIGIESPDKNTGTEFLFYYSPPSSSQLLQNHLAIKFSDQCDAQINIDACDCNGNIVDCNSDCGGNAIIDNCGICGGDDSSCILGCTFSGAENYNPVATINDGSCNIMGCTDIYSDQYNASATYDDGSCTLAINNGIIPESFTLRSYPNPFNPEIMVSFGIPEMGLVSVNVFDIRGRELETLANQHYQPGFYRLNWDASANASGVYFITLMTSDTKLAQKILLLK